MGKFVYSRESSAAMHPRFIQIANLKCTTRRCFVYYIVIVLAFYFSSFHLALPSTQSLVVTNTVLQKQAKEIEDKQPSTFPPQESSNSLESTEKPVSKVSLNRSDVEVKPGLIYSYAKKDRSGAVVQDMLLSHALAYQRNLTYGGACTVEKPQNHLDVHLSVIQALGLEHILRFECPLQIEPSAFIEFDTEFLHFSLGTVLWTPEWVAHIRSLQRGISGLIGIDVDNKPFSVVVHIRRGDVYPCGDTEFRYLPNSHYLATLREFSPETVTIFSEALSFESWDDFSQYNLRLDSPHQEVWRAMMLADVLIMSKSSFSIVPAIFNRHRVIFTPFWYTPLKYLNWTIIDEDYMKTSTEELIRLKENNCTEEKVLAYDKLINIDKSIKGNY